MKIGELSRATGTNIETIRYYERIGLLPAPDRTAANYRSYTGAHRSRLSFVRHSRELGFTIEEIRSLLDLSDDPPRACGADDRLSTAHLAPAVKRDVSGKRGDVLVKLGCGRNIT